jgi:PAS domain S-box-containing protein
VHGLLESAPDPMVVADREGGVLLVNKETERLFGCGRAELVGGRIDGILPEWSELLDRSGLGRDSEESDRHPRGPHEVVARRRDGSRFPAEIVLSPVASERGPLVSAAIRDLTGRRDEELRRRLAAIVTTSGDAIVSMRPDGTIVDWNPGAERNYGWSAREVIGRHISVLEPEEIAGEMDAILQRVRQGELVDQYETLRRRKDGERIDVSLTVSPIHNPAGVVVGASSIGRDIRDRKRDREVLQAQRDALALANAELERSNADLDQFAAVASHDLRAPLRGMASLVDWIVEDHAEALGEEGRRQLAQLRERAERMHRLIEGILEYSRSGRKSALERVSSRESMLDILDALPRSSEVQVVVAADLPTVLYDETQLTQVLQNLVGNAIQHMGRQQGRIEVFAREQDEHWEFCVADDGPGIPVAHRERIFRLFQTGPGAVRSSGVGLSVVKKIVEANGGRVWIADRDGGGAEFWFSVPKR